MPNKKETEKLSITLPEELVAELRATVPCGKLSAFLAEAAEFYLAWRRQKAALKVGFGASKDEEHPDLKTPEDSTAYVRTLREADEERLTRFEGDGGEQQVAPCSVCDRH